MRSGTLFLCRDISFVVHTHDIFLHKNNSPGTPDKDASLTGSCYNTLRSRLYYLMNKFVKEILSELKLILFLAIAMWKPTRIVLFLQCGHTVYNKVKLPYPEHNICCCLYLIIMWIKYTLVSMAWFWQIKDLIIVLKYWIIQFVE